MKALLISLSLAVAAGGCTCCRAPLVLDPGGPEGGHLLAEFGGDPGAWQVEDDAVMGGRSQGRLEITPAQTAVFSGNVSLENNGGFTSIQRDFDPVDVRKFRALVLGLRGDGKRYQVRVETKPKAPHGYAYDFQTSDGWQCIEIPFADMYAIHHGDRLDLPNYPGKNLARIQILIGNGVAESFRLEIDRIWLK